ncbi:Ref family recombination enhancement nuclease [Kistimonas scapharcae]|uniref:Ref family recombination enhancement nuclease n=1 Tax=Kistimonas scapharcae TaxID=1036133 RepID=A0ABP8V835_9GAMM
MTKDERRYQNALRNTGCIVCINQGIEPAIPASIHHIRTGTGAGQKASETDVIPLCPAHHQQGGYGVAFHAGPAIWQELYGSELELVEQVRELAAEYECAFVGSVRR